MATVVRLRDRAATDIESALDYYVREAGERTALDFVDTIERETTRIGRRPRLGSLHFAHELGLRDLRAWPLRRFPYIVFYVIVDDVIDVWRVLHARRDVQNITLDPDGIDATQ